MSLPDSVVLRKTVVGLEEISSRKLGLPQRLRTALIMVDGRSTLGTLRQAWAQTANPDEVLKILLDQGLIESSAPAIQNAAPPAPENTAPPAAPRAAAPAAAAAADTVSPEQLKTARRKAVKLLQEFMGPYADSLCIKLEKTKTQAEFYSEVAKATELLRGAGPASNVTRFLQEVEQALRS